VSRLEFLLDARRAGENPQRVHPGGETQSRPADALPRSIVWLRIGHLVLWVVHEEMSDAGRDNGARNDGRSTVGRPRGGPPTGENPALRILSGTTSVQSAIEARPLRVVSASPRLRSVYSRAPGQSRTGVAFNEARPSFTYTENFTRLQPWRCMSASRFFFSVCWNFSNVRPSVGSLHSRFVRKNSS